MYMRLPLIGEEGYLYKLYKKTPTHIPRIGETIYLTQELSGKVVNINYGGHDLNSISIYLEPISASYVKELTKTPSKLASKSHSGWKYDDGTSWIDRTTDFID